ncbi:hypothetical protein [Jiangella gansuensis]|uniref:hypothetical protein n=1 Tax=Jiangella gansuensis TaxID=281473 RepID=UPI0012F83F14|nr:hypothetical protein [Jiangella gansuensis]
MARLVAAATSLVTFAYLFLHDSWRADNLFLVPDLLLCALLLAGAMTPTAWVVPVLSAGFALTAGVLVTSVSSYAVDGELGVPSLLGVLLSAVMVVLLARRQVQRHPARPVRDGERAAAVGPAAGPTVP